MGGLEFDRDNLQWMDLSENIRKGGANRFRAEQRAQLKVQIQTAFLQAQALYKDIGFGQSNIKRYVDKVEEDFRKQRIKKRN